MRKEWVISFPIICLFQADCTREVKAPIRNVPPILVVEGLVTTSPGPYTINLSYSGPYTNSYQATQQDSMYFIADAKVLIKDDLGDSTTCTYTSLGNYTSDSVQFTGTVGRTYTLVIFLSNGQEYRSKPETIQAVPPIDSLSIGYDSAELTGILPPPLIVTVNTHDPGTGQRYYRWACSGYYPRKSWGAPCGVNQPPCTNPFVCICDAFCEQENTSPPAVAIFSNQLSEGQEIIDPVYYSPVYWFGIHYVEIDQYSLTLNSYQFWEQYLQQTDRTGSILDPLPSPVIGNIYNAADSASSALGIFSASDVYREKVMLIPFFLQEYELESVAGQYILPGVCEFVYPNAIATAPPAWDGAQVINIY